jgi:hypothetical protein
VFVCFVDIGGIIDHHCLDVILNSDGKQGTPISTKRTITSI